MPSFVSLRFVLLLCLVLELPWQVSKRVPVTAAVSRSDCRVFRSVFVFGLHLLSTRLCEVLSIIQYCMWFSVIIYSSNELITVAN